MGSVEAYRAEHAFSEIVAAIYRAAGSPTLWRRVLEDLTRSFGAFGAQLNVFDPTKGALTLSISHGCEWLTPARLRRFLELSPTDPRMPYALAHPGMPNHCRQAATESVLYASQIYKEILGPGDCEYSMVVQFPVGSVSVFIGVLRHRAQGAYTHDDVGRFSLFVPHIRRSVGLGLSLSQLDYSNHVASEAFEALSVGVALVTADLRILYRNSIAERLLARLPGAVGTLSLPAATHERIVEIVGVASDIVATGGSYTAVPPIEILCSTGRPIRIRVSGIDEDRARPLLGTIDQNCALLVIEEGDSEPETKEERLERMFGLTAAEIRVAKSVAEGRNPKVVAREIGVSPETVRSQLKAVFRKTRTESQTELVQLLGNLPVWPELPPPKLDENPHL